MSSQLDTVIKGSGNPVVVNAAGSTFVDGSDVDFNLFDDIELVYGSETYTILNNPDVISILAPQELLFSLGGTSETVPPYLDIKVFSATYPRPEGFTITNACLGNLPRTNLCG